MRVLLALALLVLCGCSGDEPKEQPAGERTIKVTLPPEPPGIRLSFIQQRFDEGTRRAGITVMNYSAANLRVRQVGLEWPGYPGPLTSRRTVVFADSTVDVRYRLPDPSCVPSHLSEEPIAVVVTNKRTIRRKVDEKGLRFLTRIWQSSCNTRRFERAVDVAYAGPWTVDTSAAEPTLVGSIVLERTDDRVPVTLTDVLGSPLFDLTLGEPRTLATDATRVAVPLMVTGGGRCDPHSRAAVTTPFTFRIWATLGDDPNQVSVIAVPDKAAQVEMLAFLDRVCATK